MNEAARERGERAQPPGRGELAVDGSKVARLVGRPMVQAARQAATQRNKESRQEHSDETEASSGIPAGADINRVPRNLLPQLQAEALLLLEKA